MKINLLPPEIRQRQRTRRKTVAVAMASMIVLAGVVALFMLQQIRLSVVRSDLREQQAVNSQLQSQITELRRFDELQREVAASRQLLTDLLANRVFWSAVLRDISLVIPGEVWLSGMTATLTDVGAPVSQPVEEPAEGTAPEETAEEPAEGTAPEVVPQPTGPSLVGQMSFTGFGLNHRAVALWLARLEDIRGFANPWLTNSQKTEITPHTVVQFNSTVDLSQQVLERGRRPR